MNGHPPAHEPAATHGEVTSASDVPAYARLRGAWKWAGVLVLLLAGLALMTLLRGGGEPPSPTADVPRIQDGRIVFSQAFRDRALLATERVRSAALTPTVSAVGMVSFDPRYTARVATRLRGVVRALRAYEGEEVERGQVLAELNSPELGEAQAQVTMLKAQLQAATRHARREASLVTQNLSTARAAEEASADRTRYGAMLHAAKQRVAALAGDDDLRAADDASGLGVHALSSPIAGTIVERHIAQGELVEGDRTAFLVAQLDHLWVELDVFERNLGAIRVGDEVDLHALSGRGGTIKGRVAQVGAVIDPATRSAPIRIEIDNKDRLLRPGQAVDAEIRTVAATATEALLVPAQAVTYVDGKPTVFVSASPLSVVPTEVVLGESNGVERQVLKGLEDGQEVVVQGVFELKSELFR